MRRDVFRAIADPTRRDIIGLLIRRPLNLNTIAVQFRISRPAVSKHIKILTECGLIRIQKKGRERYCEAQPARLNEVSAWVEQYRAFWEYKFDALENYLQNLQAPEESTRQPTRQVPKPKRHGRKKSA
ncbi:MAG TPA: metalloregulator ArsR/SmtB family transcription factor [Chitinophagaceae bacterium]|nr:metalloregulator ArsR/SmtB family transcription factor [Chitinophagaceae bacterium]